MHPHRLDLITWQWFKEPGLVPNPGPGDALMLPISRQRAAGEVVGKKWMLMHAGSPTQVSYICFNLLNPLQLFYELVLHLPFYLPYLPAFVSTILDKLFTPFTP